MSEDNLRIFRLDNKLCWMKEIPDMVIVSMIQLIYEHVDPDRKKKSCIVKPFIAKIKK